MSIQLKMLNHWLCARLWRKGRTYVFALLCRAETWACLYKFKFAPKNSMFLLISLHLNQGNLRSAQDTNGERPISCPDADKERPCLCLK
ncbi:MAG: hypothetical protein D3910_16700 [Candidatus Electrothrix sp. ATG2]|nr:hypothetical protein [Candidatus Electrothrix sp. ATG2]